MKVLRFFINRFFLATVSILLQLALFFYFLVYVSDLFIYFNVISTLLGIIAYIYIINQTINPDHKIPWLILVALVPLFGVGLFLLFSPNRVKRAHYEAYLIYLDQAKEQLPFSDDMSKIHQIDLGSYYGQSAYLYQTNALPAYRHTLTHYFNSGESFFDFLIEDLKKANSFIFLEYFIISFGYMWDRILTVLTEKIAAGIEVRIIYEDVGTLGRLPANYDKKLRELGIKCLNFNRVNILFSSIYNNRDHRKITIIDGHIGYIGGANISDEYINKKKRFGYWKDGAVRLEGEGVKAMTALFLQMYTIHAKVPENIDPYLRVEFPFYYDEGYVQPFGDGPKPLYNHQIAHTAYCQIINQTRHQVFIMTPYLIIDFVMRMALINAALRGVKVTIITTGVPDKKIIYAMTRSNYKPLLEAGVKIYEYQPGFLHTKMILADDIVGIIGTINLDYRSLVHNYECGIYMYKTHALKEMMDDFKVTLKQSKRQTLENVHQNLVTMLFCSVLNAFQTLL